MGMARLYEVQGKALLKEYGLNVPDGEVVSTATQAAVAAQKLAGSVVLKAQTWTTSRAEAGGISFADDPEQAQMSAAQLLQMSFSGVPVTQVLVEQKLSIQQEFFISFGIDDASRAPFLLFSLHGGSGVEGRSSVMYRWPIKISWGLRAYQARALLRQAGIKGRLQVKLSDALARLWQVCRRFEARLLEVNPLALVDDGNLYALDCRMAIDDYAVFRHPELGLEVARELERPPTTLDKIAYRVEAGDYRGTFYFFEMQTDPAGGPRIGFHGGGGGGSMLSMDALLQEGFQLANFSDLSGNPPASKIYRAARLILSQPDLSGYFHSGSGVASQELTQTAQALVKAFREAPLTVPAVIRLGGNTEKEAIEILEAGTQDIPVPVVGFGRDTPLAVCATKLRGLIESGQSGTAPDQSSSGLLNPDYSFDIRTGNIEFDYTACRVCEGKPCIPACPPQILALDEEVVTLAISPEAARRGDCIECAACEVACQLYGQNGLHIRWPIAELELA